MPNKHNEELLKSISALLDETIEEYDRLSKADTEGKDLKLQADENGDMPKEAGQSVDNFQALKKEEEKEEDKDEKKKEKKDEKGMDEKAMKSDDEDSKFEEKIIKCLLKLGILEEEKEEVVAKSEPMVEAAAETAPKAEEVVAEPMVKEENELLAKTQERLDKLEEKNKELQVKLEEIAKQPATSRKSVDGLRAIKKSDEDNGAGKASAEINKNQVLDTLVAKMTSGDKRITPNLVTQYELTGNYALVQNLMENK